MSDKCVKDKCVKPDISARPRPQIDELNAPFWQAASAPEPALLLQRCPSCGRLRCPPAPACPECGETCFSWVKASGKAALWSWNVFHKAYLPGFDPPYLTALVQLEEGPVIVSALPGADPARLRLGQPLKLAFAEGLPVFLVEE